MITTTIQCECSPITHQITVHGKTQRDCDEAMRKDGWKQQDGMWRCGACVLQWDKQEVALRSGTCYIDSFGWDSPEGIVMRTPCSSCHSTYPGETTHGLMTPDQAREIAGHLVRLADRSDERGKG